VTESVALTPHPDLKIISSRVFRGPNVWHYEPAIQLVVDLGVLEDFPTNKLPGFADALVERLPGLMNHTCSRGRRGGFVERLHEGTWVGHVAEHVALQLQQAVGHDMRRGKTRQVKGERGRYNVIYAYYDESVGLAAGELAVRLVNHLIVPDPGFDFDEALERFIVRGERTAFGPSTQAIVEEAVSRDIPYLRLNRASLVQLGQGVHQKRIRATMTSQTPSVAVDIASNKELTLCWRLQGCQFLDRNRSVPSTTRCDWPTALATRWSSSRSTGTMAAASCSISAVIPTYAAPSTLPSQSHETAW
jgi:cyanophycin synthetase